MKSKGMYQGRQDLVEHNYNDLNEVCVCLSSQMRWTMIITLPKYLEASVRFQASDML